MIEIKHKTTGKVLCVVSADTLRGAELTDVDLRGADLRDADLGRVNLRWADLRGADLRDANLWGADLRGTDLRGADLGRADLTGANLTGAYLGRANLTGADLVSVDLRDANLMDAYLRGTDLTGASLARADLTGANLVRADLMDANLSGADLGFADLKGAIGIKLDTPQSKEDGRKMIFSDRRPTEADANEEGNVCLVGANMLARWDRVGPDETWSPLPRLPKSREDLVQDLLDAIDAHHCCAAIQEAREALAESEVSDDDD